MKNEWPKNFESLLDKFQKSLSEKEKVKKRISALYGILGDIFGADKLILKAGKLESLNLLRSEVIEERVLGLKKLVFEDPTIKDIPGQEEIDEALSEIEEKISDLLARKAIEDSLENKISVKMQEKHDEYIMDLKKQIIKDQQGPENAQTLKKYARLEKMEQVKLSRTVMEILRPSSLEEIVGQERAVKSLLAKLAAPYPQHIIMYGPPGVGKTTAARIALQSAKELAYTPFSQEAPFIEVDGSTLRWDPREAANPLVGSVHDPIYQGAKRDLVDGGIPEPKPGLVTEAHGGILFIDEIGEIDLPLQSKLLKVLEDKRVYFDSAYYDPNDGNIPKYIKKLFDSGAPADFILIGATTRNPSSLNPAMRSRCTEVYFEPLSPEDIEEIILSAANKIKVLLDTRVPKIISQYTIEGRKAINILADAYGLALYEQAREGKQKEKDGDKPLRICPREVYEVIQASRILPYGVTRAGSGQEIGKVFGLGSSGYTGVVIEIEATVFPAASSGKGCVRFNETAGSMAKDSVFNAITSIRQVSGLDMKDYDIHVNIVGGGNIEGPSAGAAVLLAMYSAVKEKPVQKDIAITGEVSLRGKISPVGSIQEKIYGAKQAGIKKVIIPEANRKEVYENLTGIKVESVDTVEELLNIFFNNK